jgi:acetylornithine/N-succinyldiaminopimelate aminotransferase
VNKEDTNMNHILKCHEIVKTDFVRGENCYLYDKQGHKFVDFESGIWSAVLGHSHPRINQVMKSQIEKVMHLGTRYPSILAENAAIDVLDIVEIENGKCTFLSSGSEAVEFAVQAARKITKKQRLLTFTNSYLSAYGSAGRKSTDEWLLLDWSACEREGCSEYLKKIPFKNIGAFVFEPGGSGSGFVKFPSKELVQEIVNCVKQEGGLLVVNEITTGMGRTGKWFGFQHYAIQPDIVALGKGLGNGYPISAVAMASTCAEELESSGLHYAQSHQNDPLGCSVAREVISIMREGNWIDRGEAVGAYFLEGLRHLQQKYAVVKEVRGRGMLLGIEFHPHENITVSWAYNELLEMGFLVGYYSAGNVLRFDPSLTIEKTDIERLLESLDAILNTAG